MDNIGIVTDNISSLPEKIVQKYQIETVKTKLFFPEAEKFPEKNLYQIMEETKAYPKTSAPSPGDFVKVYKKLSRRFQKILVITLSSHLSGTYNSAFQAKEFLEDPSRIELVDSKHAVAGEGLLTLKAIELVQQTGDIEEIKNKLENFKQEIKMVAFLKNTFWVEKIGRMTGQQVWLFQTLKSLGIQPIIGIKKGRVGFTGFNFGSRDVFKAIFHQLYYHSQRIRRRFKVTMRVGINYTNNIGLAYDLKEKIEKELGAEVTFVSLVPPIVGANSGPGTLIAACHPKV